jgi:hypothetical protein
MVNMIQAQPVQEKTWILSDMIQRWGVLSELDDSYVFLGKTHSGTYATLKDLEQVLGKQIHFQKPSPTTTQTVTVTHVHNLPIKHDSAHNMEMEPCVTYTKTVTSGVRFAAGYWIIKFSTGWMGSLSPKLATLQEYEHVGPFSSKLEMNTMVTQKNQEFHKKST